MICYEQKAFDSLSQPEFDSLVAESLAYDDRTAQRGTLTLLGRIAIGDDGIDPSDPVGQRIQTPTDLSRLQEIQESSKRSRRWAIESPTEHGYLNFWVSESHVHLNSLGV